MNKQDCFYLNILKFFLKRDENGLSEVFKGSSNADENLTNNTGEKQESMLGIKGSYKLTNSNDPSCRIMKQTDTTSV